MAAVTKKSPLLSILIPVYNEEKTLKKILSAATSLPIEKYEVLIVDDASQDKSPDIITNFLSHFRSEKVEVITFRHPKNRGKGAGIKTGLKHAKGEYFVIQDADLEYDPTDIPSLLEAAITNNYEAVYGSRFLGSIVGMPRPNYWANRGYNKILRVLYNTEITDMHTCYKMVRTEIIKDLNITSNGFDYATELVSKLLKRGIVINEVPIRFNGRTRKEGKKINVLDGVECAYKLLRFRFSDGDKLFKEKSVTFGRFMIVGATGFIVNYLILVLLTQFLGIGHVAAEVIAAIVALQVTFLLHDRWTYQLHTPPGTERLKLPARYASYIISNAFGSFMTVVAFSFLYSYLTRLTALLVAAIVGVIWNYLMNTYIIWQRKQ
jgi:glycosyltransferase involved in cell wall biosynthesis